MTDLLPLWLSLALAGCTSLILLVLGLPLAWWLARTDHPARPFIEVITALPLVLPPTVLGFYLLIAFAPSGPVGQFWQTLTGSSLAFSFGGLVIASCFYSLPFMVQPLNAAFQAISEDSLEAASLMRAGPLSRFLFVALPEARAGIWRAIILCFAHTIGEFGVVLMIGGNIPGETQVLSVALYEKVESLQYDVAHQWAAMLLVLSFSLLLPVYWRRGGMAQVGGTRS